VIHFRHYLMKTLHSLKISKNKSELKSQPMPDLIKLCIRQKMIMQSLLVNLNNEMMKLKEH